MSDELTRIAAAAERIAAALEALAGTSQPQLGDVVARFGEVIGVPVLDGPNYQPLGERKWHAAIYLGDDQVDVQCGAKALSTFSLAEAKPLHQVPAGARCGSPGCARHYDRAAG